MGITFRHRAATRGGLHCKYCGDDDDRWNRTFVCSHPAGGNRCFFSGRDDRTVRYHSRWDGSVSALHRCSVKPFDLIEREGGSEEATSSVLIVVVRPFEKEEKPWPDASLSEFVRS